MPTQPTDILAEADILLTRNTEAAYRSCISRAYYALYHVALDVAAGQGFCYDGQSKHYHLLEHYVAKNNRVSRRMREMRQLRVNADYFLDEHMSENRARNALNECKRLIESLHKMT
jgi:uncharacterized protein (UPF0332 family)